MQMEYRHLGRTGAVVSRLCLGTMNFGSYTNEKKSMQIMSKAYDEGINFFDTANVYGGKDKVGIAEEIMGKWFFENKGFRDKIVCATKVFGRMDTGPNDRGLSALHIRKACEESLRRLKTDHIDLYQFHHIELETPWEEIWQELERLVQSGKVIYAGSSNFAGWQIAQAQGIAQSRHFLGLVCEQSLYNLAQRTVELEVIPACRAFGLGLIAWSPLAGGILGGMLTDPDQGARRRAGRSASIFQTMKPNIEAYEDLCEKLGQKPGELALAWLLSNESVTAPIIGPRTLNQLESAINALSVTIDEETLESLEDIWPGPGGEAPQAYAW